MNRRLKFLLVFCLLFFAWVIFATLAAEHLIIEKPLANADAILVLAGSSAYVERTERAAELYRQGRAPRIFLTDDGTRGGWSRAERRNPAFVELARKNLIDNGVPVEAIEILPGTVDGTKSEADALRRKIAENGSGAVLLVTSAYHTRRALRTFEKTFADNGLPTRFGIASAAPDRQTPSPRWWWLSGDGWQFVAGEYVKSVYYWVYY